MPPVKNVGKPCAGEPHARFDGRGLETAPLPAETAPIPDPPMYMIIRGSWVHGGRCRCGGVRNPGIGWRSWWLRLLRHGLTGPAIHAPPPAGRRWRARPGCAEPPGLTRDLPGVVDEGALQDGGLAGGGAVCGVDVALAEVAEGV